MTRTYLAEAPGKLFVLGEYAVLDGCPAVVSAVNRPVRARVICGGRRSPEVRIESGYGSCEFHPAEPPPIDGPLRFAIAAYVSARRRFPELAEESLSVAIHSEVDGGSTKMGLGSSAAVTVAVAAVLFAAARRSASLAGVRRELQSLALQAHSAAQGGVGSGADVAASVWGGLMRFTPRRGGAPDVIPLPWPRGMRLLVGWTGSAACSRDLVRRYDAARAQARGRHAAFLRASRACVNAFTATLERGRAPLACIDRGGELLERLADDLALPIVTPALADLVRLAHAEGAAAKLSGGGAGDCGIAFTCDPTAAARIAAAWSAHGIVPLPLGVRQEGVTLASH
jgi:phosphomevalonate kinase